MSAISAEGASGFECGAAHYLRALAGCWGLDATLAETALPAGEREELRKTPPPQKPLSRPAELLEWDRQIALWHPQQVRARLMLLPEMERRRCWSVLGSDLVDVFKGQGEFDPLLPWPSAMSRSFFRRRCLQALGTHVLRPPQLLQATALDHLLILNAQTARELIRLMALHTLLTPLKHMIERDRRESLKLALSRSEEGPLLLAYLRHLQADINEQTASITAIQFPLDQWNWQPETFGTLLDHFGLYCFSQLVKDRDAEFLEHICLKFDLPTSTQLRFLLKTETRKRPNLVAIEGALQRLAAKASDFLSSHRPQVAPSRGSSTPF